LTETDGATQPTESSGNVQCALSDGDKVILLHCTLIGVGGVAQWLGRRALAGGLSFIYA